MEDFFRRFIFVSTFVLGNRTKTPAGLQGDRCQVSRRNLPAISHKPATFERTKSGIGHYDYRY